MAQDPESFASLLSGALNDVRDLFRQEIALARYEVRQEVNRAMKGGIGLAVGAVVLAYGVLLLFFGCAYGFSQLVNWPLWAGFFVVGAAIAIIGAGLLLWARARLTRVKVVPPQTAETLKEDVEWLKRQTRSVRE